MKPRIRCEYESDASPHVIDRVMIFDAETNESLVTVTLDARGTVRVSHVFSQVLMATADLGLAAKAFEMAERVSVALLSINDPTERYTQLEKQGVKFGQWYIARYPCHNRDGEKEIGEPELCSMIDRWGSYPDVRNLLASVKSQGSTSLIKLSIGVFEILFVKN